MEIKIIETSDNKLIETIKQSLEWCHSAFFGVSYANYQAFLHIKEDLNNFLRRNGKLRVLFDIEKFITDQLIIEEFATIPGDSECKVFLRANKTKDNQFPGIYHPKLYLFFNDEKFNSIVGSSNFTLGGIRNNIECNVNIFGEKNDLFYELENYFIKIWNLKNALNISSHSDLLEEYSLLLRKGQIQEKIKTNKLSKLQKKLDKKIEAIIESREEILNEEFAYLLGLISANSEIDLEKRILTIDLYRQISNKGKEYEGYYYYPEISNYKISQYEAHKKDVERITEKLIEIIKIFNTSDELGFEHIRGYHFLVYLRFDSESIIFTELIKYNFKLKNKKIIPFIPDNILNSNNNKIVISFLKGYCDLKSRISLSDGIYKSEAGKKIISSLRMGISIPHNTPELIKKFKYLFEKIGIKKGIHYSDINKRDREYLIRIDVRCVPYGLLGTHWKRIFLKDYNGPVILDQKFAKIRCTP